MITLVAIVAALALSLVAMGVAVLLLEVLAAIPAASGRRTLSPAATPRPSVAVLVPAHNESAGMLPTLRAARSQLHPGDRLLVVADNCSDDTAAQARAVGAEVVERRDPARRGKGYALDFGMRDLAANPPDVVVVLDADCLPAPDAIDCLVRCAGRSGRPVQGLYLMAAPSAASLGQRIATFAWRVKNHARPLGLAKLRLPCQLMGTGMAFPWAVAKTAPLASGHLVEDMQLGAELALAGSAPVFEPGALVTSEFPVHESATRSQRTRWEHGHLQLLFTTGPRLLLRGIRQGDRAAVALAVDLMVPPLSLLFLVVVGVAATATAAGIAAGAPALAWAAAAVTLAMGAAFAIAWLRFGRDILSLGDLLRAPWCALAKLPLYVRFFAGRQVEWVRTRRRSE
jgi:cellulose synthase/poly-beta-1,6-N-acetylglucosamine synthase-like glycosyltransferase